MCECVFVGGGGSGGVVDGGCNLNQTVHMKWHVCPQIICVSGNTSITK